MISLQGGIHARRIADTSFAIIDFETTGLSPGTDRVVEISVVRLDPGQQPRLVFDTLVNPQRPVSATEIHGITDADVADAPRFQDIAGDLLDAIAGCVVAAYNVYFDMRFLQFELGLHGVRETPPHICLMYLRPLLGLGKRCRLVEACQCHGVRLDENHMAGADVIASGELLAHYLDVLREQQVTTFAELADCGTYKFLASLGNDPFASASAFRLNCSGRRKSRLAAVTQPATPKERSGLRDYWDALKVAVGDLQITEDELRVIAEVRERHQLKPEQIRVLHARAFASVINQFVSDQWLNDRERSKLQRFHRCLSVLGWAPGE
jgi:DNA polymerase-3 subunit epsilon